MHLVTCRYFRTKALKNISSKAGLNRTFFPILILVLAALSCRALMPIQPTAMPTVVSSPSPTPTEVPPARTALLDLLVYVPYGYAELHQDVFGPILVYRDFARMRTELGVPLTVSGASTRQEKLPLLTGIENQGFGGIFDAEESETFSKWGWDIADVDQSLYIPALNIEIFKGRFSRPEIQGNLLEKGYSSEKVGDFVIFTPETAPTTFAWKEDTIIVGSYVLEAEQDFVKGIVEFSTSGKPNLGSHPSFAAMPPLFQKSWGIMLAPSPDFAGLQKKNEEFLEIILAKDAEFFRTQSNPGEIQPAAWDYMALTFRPDGEQFSVRIIYHYLTRESAEANMGVVETTLTETPSLDVRNMFWRDLLPIDEISVQETFVIVDAHTQMKSLLGRAAIDAKDYWGFLPVEYK